MKGKKNLEEALLKRKYDKNSSVRDVKMEVIDPEKIKAKKLQQGKENVEKMEFFKSKKAREGMPEAVRRQMLIKLREKMKKQQN